jgi:release factor glutamine methyltransferase
MLSKSLIPIRPLYIQAVSQLIPVFGEDESRQLVKLLFEDYGIAFEKIMINEVLSFDSEKQQTFDERVTQLKKEVPLQYVLGKAHFFGRDFFVDPNVLIPRQETEELVNNILSDNQEPNLSVLDIGCGSGCIAITLALELTNAKVTALDIDGAALDITLRNARTYGVQATYFLEDVLLLEELPGKYDIIVSNPPYVTEAEKSGIQGNVLNHEPHKALFVPNEDPLRFYKKIILLAKKHLKPKGKLYFEINEQYGMEIVRLCEANACSCVRLDQDLNGKDRIIKTMFD